MKINWDTYELTHSFPKKINSFYTQKHIYVFRKGKRPISLDIDSSDRNISSNFWQLHCVAKFKRF